MYPFKTIAFIFLLFICSCTVFAQQGNIWYFGENAGLNFNTIPPSPLSNGAIDTKEGSSCISDANGNILFYTDGGTVYNRNHQPMPNGTGLLGNYSSAQSAIIIPKPGSLTLYYIITASHVENNLVDGYNYNVVDMTLNNGLGDLSQKNVLLFAPGTEKLTAVRHANGNDVWVITKANRSNKFRSYKIDCNGINTTPVESVTGRAVNPSDSLADAGLIKISPDGKLLCETYVAQVDSFYTVQLSKFDNVTGIVFNTIEWNYPLVKTPSLASYNIAEFSPNSRLLYTGFLYIENVLFNDIASKQLLQYDVTNFNTASILASEVVIQKDTASVDPLSFYPPGQMQIGPDGKIYFSRGGGRDLDVINYPDVYGTGCGFQRAAVNLGGRRTWLGLPTFLPNLFVNIQTSFDYTINSDCSTVNFTSNATVPGPVSWLWDFGDGTTSNQQNPVHIYTSGSNVYTVTLKVFAPNACSGFIPLQKQVSLNRNVPEAGFYTINQCGNFTVSFLDTSRITNGSISSWRWDFGDGSFSSLPDPTHTYVSTGNYNVTLTVGNSNTCGGTSSISHTVSIETKPVASFRYSGGCFQSAVQFTDQSFISAGIVNSWHWNFGDGDTSILQNPTHSFSGTGPYAVRLRVMSATGCWSADTIQQILLSEKPIARIGLVNTCVNTPVNFSDSSTITNNLVTKWYWDFGDGGKDSVQNPVHTYVTDSSFIVKQVAVSSTGCRSDSAVKTIIVGSIPTANFGYTYVCGKKSVQFSDSSLCKSGTITSWQWNFGDGNSADTKNPLHDYQAWGSKTVRLIVVSDIGCSSVAVSKNIPVNAKPVAAFGVAGGCVNQATLFSDSSVAEGSTVNSWQWFFSDGSVSSTKNLSKTFTIPGQYTAALLVTASTNCISDTAKKTFTIEAIPVASFTITNGCVGLPVLLQNNSSIAYGNIVRYNWNFGFTTSTAVLPSVSSNIPGNYNTTLQVVSENGCASNVDAHAQTIESVPVVDYNFSTSCMGKPVNFTNQSSNAFGAVTQWQWDFADGNSSNAFETTHTFDSYGKFDVILTAATANNCTASISKPVAIQQVHISAGNDTIAATNQPLQLLATGAASYLWEPSGYLNNDHVYNPVATLPFDYSYTVKGITAEGCTGYDTINIKVYNGPAIYVPTAFTPNGDGLNETLKPILPGAVTLEYFKIYNRWGELVFSTDKIGVGWDGRYKGERQNTEAFIWACSIVDYRGKKTISYGSFILIK